MKTLEILLLQYWKGKGVSAIYKYKNAIKWDRGSLVNIELIEDLSAGKLFVDLVDLSSVQSPDSEDSIQTVKAPIDFLLRNRIGNNQAFFTAECLQQELLKYWASFGIVKIIKYKHTVQEVYKETTHFLFKDITSGDLFQMVTDTASLPKEAEINLHKMATPISELAGMSFNDFTPINLKPTEEVVVLTTLINQKTEVLKSEGFSKKKALQKLIDSISEEDLQKIETINLV